MENFRRRRARLKGESEPATTLDLAFEDAHPGAEPFLPGRAHDLEGDRADLEADLEGHSSRQTGMSAVEAVVLEDKKPGWLQGAVDHKAAAFPSRHAQDDSLEILLEAAPSGPGREAAPASLASRMPSLGARFVAGVLDKVVLLVAFGLFALIFRQAGGKFSASPLSYVVFTGVAALVIFAYFASMTSLAASTPGLLWMGLEVRNLEGDRPTARECLWRAFGYLVSIGALELGFVWALVDSDGLTWHDRMSGTLVTRKSPAHADRS